MDLMILDEKTKILFIIMAIALYLIGIILGYGKGKKSMRPKTIGTIFVNPDADIKKNEPAFKMQITPEFAAAAYSQKLSNKVKYVIFELKEDDHENNGLL